MGWVWLDGVLVSDSEARIAPAERGFLLGDGAFETMRFDAGALRRWPRHQARLSATLDALAIPQPDWAALERAATTLAARHGLDRAVIRLTVGRGPSGGGMTAPLGGTPTILMTAAPPPPRPGGLRLTLLDAPRREPRNLSSRCKLTGYGDLLHARRLAQAQGADMAVLMSSDGDVACADCANLIWIRDGAVFAPDISAGAMPGTAAAAVIEAAAADGLAVQLGRYPLSDLHQAEAVVLTNAVMGAVAAASLDGRALDANHPLARRLIALEASAD